MERWAKALVGFSAPVSPGDAVVITGSIAAEPLLRAVYRETINLGGNPILVPLLPGLSGDLLRHGSDDQLTFISPIDRFAIEEANVRIVIMAETNTRTLSGVDPSRQQLQQLSRRSLMGTMLQRDATGELKWTLTLFPTDAYAQDAEMSTEDFSDFVFRACKLDRPDPVAAWGEASAVQQRLLEWLTGKEELHVVGPDTDLTLSVAGRKWINADGTKNFPDGEVFTGPVESSANGKIRFSFPVIAGGREISDIRLTFVNGKVTEASAAKGEDYLISSLDTDEGARYLGEFAFGTNFSCDRFIRNILFDEKIGGTIHMALGAGYPETGNTNQSAIHWDMIADIREGGRVEVDGQPFLVDGEYVLAPELKSL
jgi:aminopeptidase